MRELQSATERETLAQSPAVVAEAGGLAIGKALRSQPLTPKAERVGKIGQPLLQQPAVDHVGARVDGLPAEGIAQDVVHTAAARGDWQVADLERSGLDAFAANQHAIHVDFEGGGSLGRAGQARERCADQPRVELEAPREMDASEEARAAHGRGGGEFVPSVRRARMLPRSQCARLRPRTTLPSSVLVKAEWKRKSVVLAPTSPA